MSDRVGFGFDVHRFSDDARRPLILGGVVVREGQGLVGHSDADVVSHAVSDALLGAAGLGDMGRHFPDTDPAWRNADSLEMLHHVVTLVREAGFEVLNTDCTVVLEQPKVAPHRPAMEAALTAVIGAPASVKASRAEGLGALGRLEGAACWAVALLKKADT